jgi:hypothetical protein
VFTGVSYPLLGPALDSRHDALASARGKEVSTMRAYRFNLPPVGDSRFPSCSQNRSLMRSRWQLRALEELAAHVPHHKPSRRVNRGERSAEAV